MLHDNMVWLATEYILFPFPLKMDRFATVYTRVFYHPLHRYCMEHYIPHLYHKQYNYNWGNFFRRIIVKGHYDHICL